MIPLWLIIIMVVLAALFVMFVVLNILRKWYWDAIQSNLLDLAGEIGGRVMRQGFFARPVYHGRYRDADVTINFSGERSKKGRANLIDISLTTALHKSITISSFPWLQEIGEKTISEYQPLPGDYAPVYGIRLAESPELKTRLSSADFQEAITILNPFRFVFMSPRGVLFEKESEHLPQNTRHPRLREQLDGLIKLIRGLQQG